MASPQELLFIFMDAYNDDTLPDAAWWAKMEEGVIAHNDVYHTNYDPYNSVLAWAIDQAEENSNAN